MSDISRFEPADPADPAFAEAPASEVAQLHAERNRLLSGLVLTAAGGFVLAVPFALQAGAQFFLPLTAAIIIAITLVPFLEWLERHHVPSPLAAFAALTSFLVIANSAVVLIIVPASDWVRLLPERMSLIKANLAPIIDAYAQLQHFVDDMVRMIVTGPAAVAAQSVAFDPPRSLIQFAATAAPAVLVQTLFAILVIYFFLSGWTSLRRQTIRSRESFAGAMAIARVIQNVVDATSRYVLTIATINLCLGGAVALVLTILGMPSPLMWGGIVALLNFIPYFGPIVAAMLLGLGGLMSFHEMGVALMPAVILVTLHLIEANVLTPVVLGGRLRLNPLLILVSLSFWGWIWGTLGALLAVPILIILRTVLAAAGKPDIAGFLFEAGTLAGHPRHFRQDNVTERKKDD
ncbi:AI-2E family transporter [Sphingobium sufflavum]|uniref:AI-2E family transporter n=1 Tax=Sphingobium sufflavum TaxID=1129547 RepID=UPI001F2C1B2F|nr:AI-2E family transporter [Sphingobium sufflavum]MCE7796984.1 AI-2E family transporter [Sphingobium sufflavum]